MLVLFVLISTASKLCKIDAAVCLASLNFLIYSFTSTHIPAGVNYSGDKLLIYHLLFKLSKTPMVHINTVGFVSIECLTSGKEIERVSVY